MKKFQLFILFLIIVAIIAIVSKPSDETCKSKAAVTVTRTIKDQMSTNVAFVNNLVDRVAENGITVEDNFFYKSITFTFKGKTKDIGWGAFGYVNVNE